MMQMKVKTVITSKPHISASHASQFQNCQFIKEVCTLDYAQGSHPYIPDIVHWRVGHPNAYQVQNCTCTCGSPKLHMHAGHIMPTTLLTLSVIPYYVLYAHVFKDSTHDTFTFHYVGRRTRCRYIIGHKIWQPTASSMVSTSGSLSMSKMSGTLSFRHSVTITDCAPKHLYSSRMSSVAMLAAPSLPNNLHVEVGMEQLHHRASRISYPRLVPFCRLHLLSWWCHLPFHMRIQRQSMHWRLQMDKTIINMKNTTKSNLSNLHTILDG